MNYAVVTSSDGVLVAIPAHLNGWWTANLPAATLLQAAGAFVPRRAK